MVTPPMFENVRPRRDLLPVAAGVTLFMLVGTYFASQGQQREPGHVIRAFDAGAVALVVLAGGALLFRHRFPTATLATVFAAVLLYRGFGYANGPIWLALIVAYFSVVLHGDRRVAAGFAVAGFLIFPWVDVVFRDQPAPPPLAFVALAAWLLVLLGIAEGLRLRRVRAAEAIRIREEETLRRASEERLRIAQELHDALGHHLSLISV